VPLLIVGENVLIGGYDIPQIFPELIETGLAAGGIGWPDIPEFLDLLDAENMVGSNGNSEIAKDNDQAPNNKEGENISNPGISEENSGDTDRLQENDKTLTTDQIRETKLTTGTMTLSERFMQDKTGNMISAIVFLGMFISVMYTGKSAIRTSHVLKQWPNWSIAILLVIGLTVAIYMSYVEFTHTEAVCGPVGNCNTVQQSTYANLFGIIPIGSLGVIGCLAIGFAWLFTIFGPLRWRNIGLLSLWGLSLIGTLFSIYLTFLEPFVIGATCSWCLTSAIVMTLLLWASTAPITQIGGIFHLDQYWRKQ
jgi:uncharacterized membrane protein